MRLRLLFLPLLALAVSCSKAPQSLGYRIVATHPHDPTCYTQGLEFSNGRLFESSGGYGGSSIREVDPKTGTILRKRDFPAKVFAEGITLIDDELFVLTWKENTAYVLNPGTFELIRTHKYEGEGWGLTHNGTHLIMSNGSNTLHFRDPKTFAIQRSLHVTQQGKNVDLLNELEWTDQGIYANLYLRSDIIRIDPESGAVTGRLDLRDLRSRLTPPHQADVLNGIAVAPGAKHLVVTGKLWPNLFEIEITP